MAEYEHEMTREEYDRRFDELVELISCRTVEIEKLLDPDGVWEIIGRNFHRFRQAISQKLDILQATGKDIIYLSCEFEEAAEDDGLKESSGVDIFCLKTNHRLNDLEKEFKSTLNSKKERCHVGLPSITRPGGESDNYSFLFTPSPVTPSCLPELPTTLVVEEPEASSNVDEFCKNPLELVLDETPHNDDNFGGEPDLPVSDSPSDYFETFSKIPPPITSNFHDELATELVEKSVIFPVVSPADEKDKPSPRDGEIYLMPPEDGLVKEDSIFSAPFNCDFPSNAFVNSSSESTEDEYELFETPEPPTALVGEKSALFPVVSPADDVDIYLMPPEERLFLREESHLIENFSMLPHIDSFCKGSFVAPVERPRTGVIPFSPLDGGICFEKMWNVGLYIWTLILKEFDVCSSVMPRGKTLTLPRKGIGTF